MSKIIKFGTSIGACGIFSIALVSCGVSTSSSSIYKTLKLEDIKSQVLEERAVKDAAKNTSIKLAVRAEEIASYTAIANVFNKFNKGKITITSFGQAPLDYLSTASASGSVAELWLSDLNAAKEVLAKGLYAKPFDMETFMSSKNKDLYNVSEKETNFVKKDFNKAHLAINSNTSGVSFAMPLGYGTAGLMINGVMLDKDLSTTKIDIDYDIYSYVPDQGVADVGDIYTQQTQEEKVYGIRKVMDSDGNPIHIHISSMADLQNYISKAGDKDSVSYPKQGWLGYGPGAMFQRIFSLGYAILKRDLDNPNKSVASILPLKELLASTSLIASSREGVLDENKTLTRANIEKKLMDGDNSNLNFAKYLWKSMGGYTYATNAPGFMTSDWLTHDSNLGEVEPFGGSNSLFLLKAKWGARVANDGWFDKNSGNSKYGFNFYRPTNYTYSTNGQALKDGQIKVLSLPYADIDVADSISISKNASAAQSLVAKRFIKFLYQSSSDVAFQVVDPVSHTTMSIGEFVALKFSSSNNVINDKQKLVSSSQNSQGFYGGGKNQNGVSSPAYNGVEGTGWKLVERAYQTFENKLWPTLQNYYGSAGDTSKKKWSFKEYKKLLDNAFHQYKNQMDISG